MEMDAAFGSAGAPRGVQPERGIVFVGLRGFQFFRSGSSQVLQRVMSLRILSLRLRILVFLAYDYLLQVAQFFLRNRSQMRQQRPADQSDTRTAIVENIFIILWFRLRVDGDGDSPNLDCSEKRVEKFRRIEKQKKNAFFRS